MRETLSVLEELSPDRLLRTMWGFTRSRILATAVDLDVFQHIADGAKTATAVAQAAGSDERAMHVLLNALVGLRFLTQEGGQYGLTSESAAFLVRGGGAYYGTMVQHPNLDWGFWSQLTETVRTGQPPHRIETEAEGPSYFRQLAEQIFPWSFDSGGLAAAALGIGTIRRGLWVLDVGAGSAAWSLAFAQRDPTLRVVAQDWPEVLELARQHVAERGLEKSYEYLPGELQEVDLGEEVYHLVILGHVCHTLGAEGTRTLLKRLWGTLKPGGELLIADLVVDDARTQAVFPLVFAVNLLLHTAAGGTFSASEYAAWLEEAGFTQVEFMEVAEPCPSPLILARRPE